MKTGDQLVTNRTHMESDMSTKIKEEVESDEQEDPVSFEEYQSDQ